MTIGGDGSSLTVAGGYAYTQTGGSTLINQGGELDASAVSLQGGTIQVDGTVDYGMRPVEDLHHGAGLDGAVLHSFD